MVGFRASWRESGAGVLLTIPALTGGGAGARAADAHVDEDVYPPRAF